MRISYLLALVVASLPGPLAAQDAKPATVAREVEPPPILRVTVPPAEVAPPRGRSIGPQPIGNSGTWVTPADYPAAALREELHGTSGLMLEIDAKGDPVSCIIIASSGNALLDSTACEKVMERAIFHPARDTDGNAVSGRWSTRVVWVMPPRDPAPGETDYVLSMIVEKDGRISACEVEQSEGDVLPEETDFCDTASGFEPILDDSGEPVRRRVRVVYRVVHEPLP